MGEVSTIQWTEATWNPWHGCKKVSAGCKFCYMYRDKERYGVDPTIVVRSIGKFKEPLKWKEPKLVFTCSWSDWFIEEADAWRSEAWAIIKATPHLTYQILTKRPERIADHLPPDWGPEGYPNVWLGVSVEDQAAADTRIPILLQVPARVLFLSCEPLIGPVDLEYPKSVFPDGPRTCCSGYHCACMGMPTEPPILYGIDWVIVGGESGNDVGKYQYRPCEIPWIQQIKGACLEYSVPVFVKQMGTAVAKATGMKDRHGGDITEWLENLKIRQFPKYYKNETI